MLTDPQPKVLKVEKVLFALFTVGAAMLVWCHFVKRERTSAWEDIPSFSWGVLCVPKQSNTAVL